jgi:hypothetical protein
MIRPVRIALENQRDDLLAFASVLDDKLPSHECRSFPFRLVGKPAFRIGCRLLRRHTGRGRINFARSQEASSAPSSTP